jgi:hypothetical protein
MNKACTPAATGRISHVQIAAVRRQVGWLRPARSNTTAARPSASWAARCAIRPIPARELRSAKPRLDVAWAAADLVAAAADATGSKRMTFADGERALSAWMAENAYVSWIVRRQPWELEDYLIALDLPLNPLGNKRNRFHPMLTAVRARCVARARDLPVLPNPGTGGR